MPRYEQYKSKYRGVNYTRQTRQTRQIRNESKETNLKKPLIISAVFIVLAAVIFSIIRNYAPVVDIAIKDFFSINHQEALALESDGMEESADKLSFLNNIPLFNFFIKSDTNETLSVMAYETNSMLEAYLSDNNLNNNNFTNSINREALSPFFNDNYNSSIYRNNESQNNNEYNNQSSENSAENNNIINNDERSYNYIEQMIIESRRNDNSLNSNNSANNNLNNNSSAIRSESISQVSNFNSNSQGSSIFEEILKPKENTERVVKTMKPASTSFSSTVPSYMQKDNNQNNDSDRKINNNGNNNYNSFFKDIEYNNGEPANNNQNNDQNNNRERIINNFANNSSSISISKRENNNDNRNNISRKNIIEDTIFNNRNVSNPTDYERVVNDMVNPNISRDIPRDISKNISRNNDNANNIRNNNINNGNNTQNVKRDNKEEIMKKASEDVARYKRQKANNRINRDFNNIKMKSKEEGIYLVEYNENTGDITLIFRNRNFDISIENAIKTLLNGATDEENGRNIISCIPKNTRLLDIFVENDTVYLNFNEDFEFNPLGNEGTMIQIYQFVYTATQFEGIDKVIFLINGNLNETIGSEGAIENTAFTRFER